MQLEPIETAPRDGTFIILHDEKAGVYEVARWSRADGRWSQEQSEPVGITPTHWTYFPEAHGSFSAEPNGGKTVSEFARPSQAAPRSARALSLGHALIAFCSVAFSAVATVGLLCLSALNTIAAGE